jgi:hypothetical protein
MTTYLRCTWLSDSHDPVVIFRNPALRTVSMRLQTKVFQMGAVPEMVRLPFQSVMVGYLLLSEKLHVRHWHCPESALSTTTNRGYSPT